MRSHVIGLSLLACLALVPVSRAQDKKPESNIKLPFNPWATATVGDWSVHAASWSGTGAPPFKPTLSQVVEKIEGDKVSVTVTDSGMGKASTKTEVHDSKSLSLDDFAPTKRSEVRENGKVEDAKRTVGGKEFACSKISWTMPMNKSNRVGAPAEKGPDATMAVWISKDVKGGLVAVEMTMQGPQGPVTMTMELKGFGSKGKTEWGQSIAEVEKAAAAEHPKKE